MRLFGKFNNTRKFDIDTTNFSYYSLEDLFESDGEGQEYVIRGLYINTKGLYDPAPVAALDDKYVNLPAHLITTVEQILDDPRAVQAIKDGHCGFKIRQYEKAKYNKMCYTIDWLDI